MAQHYLFYSDKCTNSSFFISQLDLDTNKKVNSMITRISVHEPSVALPPSVVSVPHMVIIDERGMQHDLVGDDLFAWLVQQTTGQTIEKRQAPPPLSAEDMQTTYTDFDPVGLTSAYSLIDNPEQTNGDLYEYVNEGGNGGRLNTRLIMTDSGGGSGSKGQKQSEFDERMRRLEEERKLF